MKALTTIFTICLSIFINFSWAQGNDAGLYIDPATIDFNLLNGQSSSSQITIVNKLNIKKQFSIYINDWQRDTLGKHLYQVPGTNSRTCSKWISLDKTFVELEPGQSTVVNVKMTVPDSADAVKQMRWAMVFIESIDEKKVPTKADGVMTSVQTKFRVGVHVYQTPPTKINKEVRMLSFEPVPDFENQVYRIVCENVGDVQLKCSGFLELSNLSDGSKTMLPAIDFPMFPEQKRYIDFMLPKGLAKGKYTVMAMIDAGEDVPLEAAQKQIDIN